MYSGGQNLAKKLRTPEIDFSLKDNTSEIGGFVDAKGHITIWLSHITEHTDLIRVLRHEYLHRVLVLVQPRLGGRKEHYIMKKLEVDWF